MGLYQFRYFGNNDSRSIGDINPNKADLIKDINQNEIVKKVGIQTLPGAKIFLNGNTKGITVGASGIIEFEAKNGAYITELGIDKKTLEKINNKSNWVENNENSTETENNEDSIETGISVLKEDELNILQDHCYLIMDIYTTDINNGTEEEDSSSNSNAGILDQTEVE